jgi:cytochrome c oxidase subunit 2
MIRYSGKDGKFGERIIDPEHITPTNELGINWNDPKSHDDFMSDKLYLVKGRPVLMKLGAQDVLHSFYLPHFRVKMDCVPGLPTEFYFTPTMTTVEMQNYLSTQPWWQTINPETGEPRWKTFKYELACAELCGKSHFGMEREVVVVTQTEYDEWLAKQTPMYQAPVAESTAVDTVKKAEEIKKPTAMLEAK